MDLHHHENLRSHRSSLVKQVVKQQTLTRQVCWGDVWRSRWLLVWWLSLEWSAQCWQQNLQTTVNLWSRKDMLIQLSFVIHQECVKWVTSIPGFNPHIYLNKHEDLALDLNHRSITNANNSHWNKPIRCNIVSKILYLHPPLYIPKYPSALYVLRKQSNL